MNLSVYAPCSPVMDGRSVLEQDQCYNSLICDSDVNNFGCSMMLGMKAMSYTQIIIIFF